MFHLLLTNGLKPNEGRKMLATSCQQCQQYLQLFIQVTRPRELQHFWCFCRSPHICRRWCRRAIAEHMCIVGLRSNFPHECIHKMPIASALLILALASLTEALKFLRHVANHILLVEEVYGTVLKPSSIPRFGNSPASRFNES